MDSEEVVEQQNIPEDSEYEIRTPLVGPKEPITSVLRIIGEESHEIYKLKKEWIVQNYVVYRYIIGDGNCGWRAIIFALFEILLRSGSHKRCLDQISRMKSLEILLKSLFNYEEFVYEDFRDPTLELLQWIADAVPCTDDTAALTEKFNNPGIAAALIQWFRMIASAWMTKHAVLYEGFMGDVTTYRKKHIDPHAKEIEEYGIKILFDAVIEPAGIDVEIVYLDLSDTNGIPNIHRYEPRLPSGEPKPGNRDTIRLLYSIPQGAHYDLLYKEQDFPENPQILLSNAEEHYQQDDLMQREQSLMRAQFRKFHGPKNHLEDPLFSFPGHPEFPTATVNHTGNSDRNEDFQDDYLFVNEYVPINPPDVAFQPVEPAFEVPLAMQPEQTWRSRVDQRTSDDPIRTHVLGYVARDMHMPAPPNLQQPSSPVTYSRTPELVDAVVVNHQFVYEDPAGKGKGKANAEESLS
ncbi:hypothetical protein MMC11_008920 [Xylographa trunciseda]|nr:hypothetical protein [Xylographa trunciseda]